MGNIQDSMVWCSVVQIVRWYVCMYSVVCSVMQCSTVQWSAVQCFAVQYRKSGGGDGPYLHPVSPLHSSNWTHEHCTLHTGALPAIHYTLWFTHWTLYTTLCILNTTLLILHFTRSIVPTTLYTLHNAHCILHSVTLQCSMCNSVQCTAQYGAVVLGVNARAKGGVNPAWAMEPWDSVGRESVCYFLNLMEHLHWSLQCEVDCLHHTLYWLHST